MTGERSWRIPDHVVHTHDGDSPMAAAMCLRCMLELHIADGELRPDTRLQAIADAWSKYRSPEGWVEGIVPILDLLDALVEEPIDTVSRIGREQDAMEER